MIEKIKSEEEKHKPWGYQTGKLMSPQELASKMFNIVEDGKLNVAVALSMIYLAGGRREEVCEYHRENKLFLPSDFKPSIRFCDIWINKIKVKGEPKEELVINVRVLKTKKEREVRREVFIPVDENHYCWSFVQIIEMGMEEAGWLKDAYEDKFIIKNSSEQPWFYFSSTYVERMCRQYIGVNLHSLRNFRFSHLAKIEKLSIFEIQKLGMWVDFAQPVRYVLSDSEDVRNKSWGVVEKEEKEWE